MVRFLCRRSGCALIGSVALLGMGALTSAASAQYRSGYREAARCAPAPALCESPRYTVAYVDRGYGNRHRDSRRYDRCEPVRTVRCEPVRVERCEPVRVERCEPVRVERCEPVRVERCEPVRCEEPRCESRGFRTGFSLSAIFRF